jgi:hypothetical protein
VTNDWATDGHSLTLWHRDEAGTIEQVHRTLTDELGPGVYLSAKFGPTPPGPASRSSPPNLLELLKEVALAGDFRDAHPKRLRFAVFTACGRVVRPRPVAVHADRERRARRDHRARPPAARARALAAAGT